MKVLTMDRTLKYILIGLLILIILTPIGLFLGGDTFGEWSAEELQQKLGYVPSEFSGLSHLWNAPLADYGIPGLGNATIGYLASAVLGVVICGGVLYLIGKLVAKKDSD